VLGSWFASAWLWRLPGADILRVVARAASCIMIKKFATSSTKVHAAGCQMRIASLCRDGMHHCVLT